jgi:hypothetical protein
VVFVSGTVTLHDAGLQPAGECGLFVPWFLSESPWAGINLSVGEHDFAPP